jgi:REP element-mobilizing transposase RayT
MTAPRQVLAGTTYLVTRRCTHRQFLLKPRPVVNETFRYLLAVAANRYGVQVHAFVVLSNHYHLIVTDRDARLPAFHQFLDALLARALNASLGRWEAFWAPDSYSAVALASPADILAKAAYVLANPVAAGLVRRGRDWPGLWSSPEQIGAGAISASRPKHFFDPNGSMPASASLRLTPPPDFDSADDFRAKLSASVAALEEKARREQGGAFLGVSAVLAQKPTARPRGGEPRRGLNPRVACRDKWKRIEVLARLRRFLRAYRDAWKAWCEDASDVQFPAGTYQLRVVHGVPCLECG